jgi:hypothetical protein
MIEVKLETRYPSHQNAVELFGNRWLIRLEELYPGLQSGPGNYLRFDDRPVKAANRLGFVRGSLHGMRVLELGPMEGAHTYQLSKLGAESVLAIEANTHAFLRCLVMKEILQPANVRFLLGDCLAYLQQNQARFDMIFCSGILYHMQDPFELIRAMAARTDRIFLWSHYFDPAEPKGPPTLTTPVTRDGLELTYYQHDYGVDPAKAPFWGGVTPLVSWMGRDDIVRCFEHFGFEFTTILDDRELAAGHALTAAAKRP